MILLVVLSTVLAGAAPVLRVIQSDQAGESILENGGFEEARGEEPKGWGGYKNGFRLALGEGRGGSRAAACENLSGSGEFGVTQILHLNRSAVYPLRVRGSSKAENVSGSPDQGYSLYVDMIYADGTPQWGETANFRTGTHDWERREFLILPRMPVRQFTIYCLFRGHRGKVWFDDISVEEVRAAGGAILFQGLPVELAPLAPATRPVETVSLATRDGLELIRAGSSIPSIRLGSSELPAVSPSGFLVRDVLGVGANSHFFGFAEGKCPELGLELNAKFLSRENHIAVSGRISGTSGMDRAVTLIFALGLDAMGWQWGDDIRRRRTIEGRGEYTNAVSVRCGSTGTQSLYPVGAVYSKGYGLALAIDMGKPALYRLAYHAGTRQLLLAYDFALVKDTERFPQAAEFRFVLYRFDPEWGFRSAWEKLAMIFPDYFLVRSKTQGIWMPFTDVSTVQGWQDFGFRYHEGTNNIPFDDANGILSFRYTEPMTWWMPMEKDLPRTEPEALRLRDALARGAGRRSRMAQVTKTAGMAGPGGEPRLLFRDTPWCNGAVWSLNPNPHLPGPFNGATVYWNEEIRERLYGKDAKGDQDGEYLDSLEGYVTADLNFRREHFRHSTVPLTFSSEGKPALFKGLAVYEFTRWIAEDIHRLGKLTFANSVPYRFTYLCPWLDVMGTETNWLRGRNRYQPASDAQMCLWRSLAFRKPYLLLMNTDYEAFAGDLVERYFERSLFYGIFPSMFSHNASENPYWKNPGWYNRDRSLFQKYLPLIRQVAEAGWEPVTGAVCDNPEIFLERFGRGETGSVFLTLLNDTEGTERGTVTLNLELLGLEKSHPAMELISRKELKLEGSRFSVILESQKTWLVRWSVEK